MEIIKRGLAAEMGQNFIDYAGAVNQDRAIPDAVTGLKPVARRILYIMHDEKIVSNKPHKKCAKVTGSVMGRVHPHGDSSIYEAMARLAQPWVMRYPLIDWHGNYGNQGGDGPAAARYTESRLAKISEEGLLLNLKKKVDWQHNYSEDELEPVTLPALFPNLLCNPNTGIGVAMACNFASHNLTEVGNLILDYIKNGEVDYSNMAPDFATGGTIVNGNELAAIYKTGKGKAVVRGRYETEAKGKTSIVFTEIPFGVKTEDLLEDIAAACEKETIKGIAEIRNESGKKGLRIVFELSKGVSEKSVLASLFANTNLQKTISVNQVALVGKEPRLLNWNQCIELYIKQNLISICNETKYDLEKMYARLEIVNGLLKALEDIDNVIALIKSSKSASDAKENLKTKYNFTENQAKAIVDMKLGKLANLETIELNNEKTELDADIKQLNTLLESEELQRQKLYVDLKSFIDRYGDKRRTQVENLDLSKDKSTVAIIPEDIVVTALTDGTIKRVAKAEVKTQKRGGKGVKNKGEIVLTTLSTNTTDTLMIFTTKGLMYRLSADSIPNSTKVNISSLVNMKEDEEVAAITALSEESAQDYVVFFTKNGLVKKTRLSEYTATTRKNVGIIAVKIKEGDELANIILMKEEDIFVATKKGMAIKFGSQDISAIGRNASGVKSISLTEGDEVLKGLALVTNTVAVVTTKGYGKTLNIDTDFNIQGRGGKGVIYSKSDVAGIALVQPDDSIMLSGSRSISVAVKELPALGRIAAGNIVIKDSIVTNVTRI